MTLLLPSDEAYALFKRRFVRGDWDLSPHAIACCRSPREVADTMAFAAELGMGYAVRSGGHCYADRSSTEDILLDISGMRSIDIDGDLVRVGAGVRLGPLAEALAERGRVLPTGSCPTVGISGITLAGGFGLVGRKFGLTLDQLVGAEVVLRSGAVVKVDSGREPELFWALRGVGDASLGVVTSLSLRSYELAGVTAFRVGWPIAHAARVIGQWQGWAPSTVDDVVASVALTCPDLPEEEPEIEVFGVSCLDGDGTSKVLSELLGLVGVPGEGLDCRMVAPREAARLLSGLVDRSFAPTWLPAGPFPQPCFQMVRSEFFDRPLPTDVIERLVELAVTDRAYGEYRDLEFAPWGGAYADPLDDTAFSHRSPSYLVKQTVLTGARADPERRRAARAWVNRAFHLLRPHGTGRVYQGYPDPDLPDEQAAYHGPHLARLNRARALYG